VNPRIGGLGVLACVILGWLRFDGRFAHLQAHEGMTHADTHARTTTAPPPTNTITTTTKYNVQQTYNKRTTNVYKRNNKAQQTTPQCTCNGRCASISIDSHCCMCIECACVVCSVLYAGACCAEVCAEVCLCAERVVRLVFLRFTAARSKRCACTTSTQAPHHATQIPQFKLSHSQIK
jgi:hypothetical protein